MNFFFGTLLVFARVSLALRVPKNIGGLSRTGNVSHMEVVDRAIRSAPRYLEHALAFEKFMNGSHGITDALETNTRAPGKIRSFLELEGKMQSAMERSHASVELRKIRNFASKALLGNGFGIDSINVGLAKAGAPWYSLMKSVIDDKDSFDYFDSSDVKLIADMAFFVNIAFKGKFEGKWRMCMAAGMYASFFFKGKYYAEPGFKGSEFGSEDFYLGFAKTDNVPGWSWSMAFAHDYVTRTFAFFNTGEMANKEGDEFAKKVRQYEFGKLDHQFHHLSRLSGGFEFTTAGPLRDLVAINFGYCLMGRSDGGRCVDSLEGEERTKAEAELEARMNNKGAEAASFLEKTEMTDGPKNSHRKGNVIRYQKKMVEHTNEDDEPTPPQWPNQEQVENAETAELPDPEQVENAEKWSKNTVQTGIGHCWCGTTKSNAGWKTDNDVADFS